MDEYEKYIKELEMTREERYRHQAIGNMFCNLKMEPLCNNIKIFILLAKHKASNFTKLSDIVK